jgi:hypothetical protein
MKITDFILTGDAVRTEPVERAVRRRDRTARA